MTALGVTSESLAWATIANCYAAMGTDPKDLDTEYLAIRLLRAADLGTAESGAMTWRIIRSLFPSLIEERTCARDNCYNGAYGLSGFAPWRDEELPDMRISWLVAGIYCSPCVARFVAAVAWCFIHRHPLPEERRCAECDFHEPGPYEASVVWALDDGPECTACWLDDESETCHCGENDA